MRFRQSDGLTQLVTQWVGADRLLGGARALAMIAEARLLAEPPPAAPPPTRGFRIEFVTARESNKELRKEIVEGTARALGWGRYGQALARLWADVGEKHRAGLFSLAAARVAAGTRRPIEAARLADQAVPWLDEALDTLAAAEAELVHANADELARHFPDALLACVRAESRVRNATGAEASVTQVRASLRRGSILGRMGRYKESVEVLRATRTTARIVGRRAEEGDACDALGLVSWSRGEHRESSDRAKDAIAIRRALGDRGGEAESLNRLGLSTWAIGGLDEAYRVYSEGLVVAREIGSAILIGTIVSNLGTIAVSRARNAEATLLYEECLRLSNACGLLSNGALAAINLGSLHLYAGDAARCESFYREGLALYVAAGNPRGDLLATEALAAPVGDRAGPEAALRLLDDAIARAGALEVRDLAASCAAERAYWLYRAGRNDLAEQAATTALRDARAVGHIPAEVRAMKVLALIRKDPSYLSDALAKLVGAPEPETEFRLRIEKARLHRARQEEALVREECAKAILAAQSLGAVAFVREAETLLAEAGKVMQQ